MSLLPPTPSQVHCIPFDDSCVQSVTAFSILYQYPSQLLYYLTSDQSLAPFPSSLHTLTQDLSHLYYMLPVCYVATLYLPLGTTWGQHIANLVKNQGEDDKKRITESVPWPEEIFVPMQLVNGMSSPRIFKSHNPYHMMMGGVPHTSPARYIYIARNPKVVAVSYYHLTRGFEMFQYSGTWENYLQLFMNGRVYFGLWFDHVLEWWKHRDAENILFLKYEDMKKDHCGAVIKIAEFMGYKLKEEVIDAIVEKTTFQSMKANPATNYDWSEVKRKPDGQKFLRKGVVGDWRNYFTPDQNVKFDEVYAEKMKNSGLEFDFD